MFGKKQKAKKINLYNPVDGKVTFIDECSDPVFAQKIIGDGFVVEPINGKIYSPLKGIITSIFPANHAIGITTDDGKEFLVHIGINTVELNGEGFEILVDKKSEVTKDTQLANVDLERIRKSGFSTEIIVVLTNSENDNLIIDAIGDKRHGESIATLLISN
ncbi:hypothetical protein IGI39_004632 [Enterococcus sp. AZ135]|uniref:PTS sugar transporter subunit IIA n=1 Tax=unclassified Enterococcus TaxID=2608891 RepID=UPI003F273E0D